MSTKDLVSVTLLVGVLAFSVTALQLLLMHEPASRQKSEAPMAAPVEPGLIADSEVVNQEHIGAGD